jgi:hypothetical protein
VRALPLNGPPEGAQFGLAQVAMVLSRRHLDHAAQRQRGVHFHQQLLDGVVVDLLDDGAQALHVVDHHLAEARAAHLGGAVHQAGEVVGDLLAGDGLFPSS